MNERDNRDREGDPFGEETMALLLAIRGQGIMDSALLNLFEATPRRIFLNAGQVQSAIGPDSAAPISCGQVQTPPTVIASVLKALDVKSTDKVLEIGTGSGYQAALLSRLCRQLHTIDRFHTLIMEAEQRFQSLKLANVVTRVADGELGWPEPGIFDCIVVNAAVSVLPSILLDQLKLDGVIVAPILQPNGVSHLVAHVKAPRGLEVRQLSSARFLPLISGVAMRL